jgi:hypothetical protein
MRPSSAPPQVFCAPDCAPRGVVQAPTAAVEPPEPRQLAEAERGCEQALAQEHPPHVVARESTAEAQVVASDGARSPRG